MILTVYPDNFRGRELLSASGVFNRLKKASVASFLTALIVITQLLTLYLYVSFSSFVKNLFIDAYIIDHFATVGISHTQTISLWFCIAKMITWSKVKLDTWSWTHSWYREVIYCTFSPACMKNEIYCKTKAIFI